eukprot:1038590-Rhodomonas_salina.1
MLALPGCVWGDSVRCALNLCARSVNFCSCAHVLRANFCGAKRAEHGRVQCSVDSACELLPRNAY